jgi:hypothetical protein
MSDNDARGIDLAMKYIIPETDRYIANRDPERCPATWKADDDDGDMWQCSLEPNHTGEIHAAMSYGFIADTDTQRPLRTLIPSALWKDEGALFA